MLFRRWWCPSPNMSESAHACAQAWPAVQRLPRQQPAGGRLASICALVPEDCQSRKCLVDGAVQVPYEASVLAQSKTSILIAGLSSWSHPLPPLPLPSPPAVQLRPSLSRCRLEASVCGLSCLAVWTSLACRGVMYYAASGCRSYHSKVSTPCALALWE